MFHGATWFCMLNWKSEYWQVKVSPPDRGKTTFTADGNSSLWSDWKDMPHLFGWCVCLWVDSRWTLTVAQHRVREAKRSWIKLSPKKCQLFQKEVCYLGFLIPEKGLASDLEKTNAIATWPVQKDTHEVKSFLGLCSYLLPAICQGVCSNNKTPESANGIPDSFPLDKWMPASIWRSKEALQPTNPGIPRSKETVYFGHRCQSEGHWKCSSGQWSRKGHRLLQLNIN